MLTGNFSGLPSVAFFAGAEMRSVGPSSISPVALASLVGISRASKSNGPDRRSEADCRETSNFSVGSSAPSERVGTLSVTLVWPAAMLAVLVAS